MATLTTTNIIGSILLPNNSVASESYVHFHLDGFDTDIIDGVTIPPRAIKAPLDASGNLNVNLWPNERGTRNTLYAVLVGISDGVSVVEYAVGKILAPAAGPVDLNNLLPLVPPSDVSVEDYIAQLAAAVAVAEASAVAAEASAVAAEASSNEAGTTFLSWDSIRTGNTTGADRVSFFTRLLNDDGADVYSSTTLIKDDTLSESTSCVTSLDGFHYGPSGEPSPLSYGAAGGKAGNTGTLLSDRFGTLLEAQGVYPKASSVSETIDDMAFQKSIDAQRNNLVSGIGDQEINKKVGDNTDKDIRFAWPRGVFYISRSLDFTSIRANHGKWTIHADNCVIIGTTAGKAVLDLASSRACVFSGSCTIIGKWTSAGVPRTAIQIGRSGSNTLASDSHNFLGGGWNIKGRFSLASVLNSASEGVNYGHLFMKNSLDHRVRHVSFDGSDGVKTFTAAEPVTWAGGTGFVTDRTGALETGQVAIRVVTGTLADGTVFTGTTSTKAATVNGAPVAEPAGEGPDGRSYVIIQDGSNKWGLTSDYVDDPAVDVAASFLGNKGVLDARHTGYGDAMWICSRATNHNFAGAYLVATDNDSAALTVYFNTTDDFKNFTFVGHLETDEGDLDNTTGMGHAVRLEAASAATNAQLTNFMFRDNVCHAAYAAFTAGTNINSVTGVGVDININALGRDVGQVMFDAPAKFTMHGSLSSQEANTTFLNVSSLAGLSGNVFCADIDAVNVKHATSCYVLADVNGAVFYGDSVGMVNATGAYDEDVNQFDGTIMTRYRHRVTGVDLWLDGTEVYNFGADRFTPAGDNVTWSGSSSRRWERLYSERVYAGSFNTIAGVQLFSGQEAAIPDATGGTEVATINSLLAAARNAGWLAT